jgi:hypothetical protein
MTTPSTHAANANEKPEAEVKAFQAKPATHRRNPRMRRRKASRNRKSLPYGAGRGAPQKRRWGRNLLMIAVPLALVAGGGYVWVTGGRFQDRKRQFAPGP